MTSLSMSLQSIRYSRGKLDILDQLLLPQDSVYISINNTEDGWSAIRKMQVRGAPAIAIVGSLSLAIQLLHTTFDLPSLLVEFVEERLSYLVTARPTAVNMAEAADAIITFCRNQLIDHSASIEDIKLRIIEKIEAMLEKDLEDNRLIGSYCAQHILDRNVGHRVSVLTHCNTGSLATAGYGTALGAVRSLHAQSRLDCCYFTETRPYNQGSRLTAYELLADSLPHRLICDNMAAALMHSQPLAAVVVGADRVVANGDVANKIGTYQLAVLARHHGVPFYVCAGVTSIDFSLSEGSQITIEERPHSEMTTVKGIPLAPEGVSCWNPAFDITPAHLITGGIATEHGVFSPHDLAQLNK